MNVSCTAVDESRIHCRWQPPPRKDRNGRIVGYTVRYRAVNNDASFTKSVNDSVLSIDLEKLQAYTEYHIDVAAKTSKGLGPFSHYLSVTTHETGKSQSRTCMHKIARITVSRLRVDLTKVYDFI